jgi:multicomponent Na+:H+ antiporter subunit E
MKLFLVNLGLALLWTFLSSPPSLVSFVLGFGVGFVLTAAGERMFPGQRYSRRVLALGRFVLRFCREFALANFTVAAVVLLRSRDALHPGYLTYDVTGLSPLEILLLSHCISLTPGTTSVEIEDEGRTLLLHALDAKDPEEVRRSIDRLLKEPMLAWTR